MIEMESAGAAVAAGWGAIPKASHTMILDRSLPVTPDVPLISPENDKQQYTVYTRRWYILFAFSLMSFNQCIIWLSFSPIATATREYYHLCHTPEECAKQGGKGQGAIDLMLAWGPIIYLPTAIPLGVYAMRRSNLRKIVVTGAVLSAVAAIIRCALAWHFGNGGEEPEWNERVAVPLVHVAQALNAAVGPIAMATVTLVSATWFPPSERYFATACALMSNQMGAAVGFFAFVLVKDAKDIPKLLNAHLILTLPVLLMILIYFPSQPPTPPCAVVDDKNKKQQPRNNPVRQLDYDYVASGTTFGMVPDAADVLGQGEKEETASFTELCKEFCSESAALLTANKPFVLLAWAGGALQGMYNGWSGSLDSIVPQEKFTVSYCGWVGFASTIAQIVGALFIGRVVDRWVPSLQRRMKTSLLVLLLVCGAVMAWITLALPLGLSAKTGKQPDPLIDESIGVTAFAIVLYGAVLGCTSPLFFEFAVELTFPAPEALSAGIIAYLNNVGCLILLGAKGWICNNGVMNAFMFAMVVIAGLGLFFVRAVYKRLDAQEAGDGQEAERARQDMDNMLYGGQ